MKKVIAFLAGLLLMVGATTTWALPAEWGVISPSSITGTPTVAPNTDFGYYIWTDDEARTNWHIRWVDGLSSGTTLFSGTIALQNSTGSFATYSFESNDSNFSTATGDTYFSRIEQGIDGIDFTISQIAAPSYVGFDLFYQAAAMDSNFIFLGGIEQTVASLGQDQDFAIAAPVPEPGTFVLLGAGLLGVGIYGRRRTKK